ncbi:MAG TPA: DUF459 domain-containing protein [Acidimicrobiia bacterium]|nr:DUF459 domain-containing protein [Acidimicrobiia bacterium]
MEPTEPPAPNIRRPRVAVALVVALVAVVAALVAVVDSSEGTKTGDAQEQATPSVSPTTTTPGAATKSTRAPIALTPSTKPATPSKPVFTPSAAVPLRLWVGGDSLAAGPSWAVYEAAKATGVVKTLAEYQVGTGLVRNEFWDWPKHMDAVVRARDPQITVFMVGANDDQGIEVDGTSYQPPDPQWVNEYRRRVDSLMETLTSDGRYLIWIGLPPMKDPQYSASMQLVNLIMQQEASKHRRVDFIDAWTMFSAPGAPGTYAQDVPDENGQSVDVRLDDGIHLDADGSERLARAVMVEVGKIAALPRP